MVKEVKTMFKKQVKNKFLLDILQHLESGKSPSQFSKEKNISKQKLNYYIRQLKDKDLIKKIGYGVWEVKRSKNSTKVTLKEVRGHAFLWRIKIPEITNWDKREKILERKGMDYKMIGVTKSTPRIMFRKRKIWLSDKALIIYEPESFFGETSVESRKLAVYKLLEILTALEEKLGVSFKIKGRYKFKVSRQHYSLIKNALAIQCNEEGEKINVFDDSGMWFTIDNSYNLQEAETLHPKTALTDNVGVQNYFNSHKRTNFSVTPEFTLKAIDGLTTTLSEAIKSEVLYGEHHKSHVGAITTLGEQMKDFTAMVRELKDEIKKLSKT